jgi:hypothetical protein
VADLKPRSHDLFQLEFVMVFFSPFKETPEWYVDHAIAVPFHVPSKTITVLLLDFAQPSNTKFCSHGAPPIPQSKLN